MSTDWAAPGARASILHWEYGKAREGHGDRVTVGRLTPTLIVLTDGRRFRRTDGKALGNNGTLEPISWLAGQAVRTACTAVYRRLDRPGQTIADMRTALTDAAGQITAALAKLDAMEAATDV